MDIVKEIRNNKIEYEEAFSCWLQGNEIEKKEYVFIINKMQECINNEDGDLKKFYFYNQDKKCELFKSERKEMKIFIDMMYFIKDIVNVNEVLNKFGYSKKLPVSQDIEDEFVDAIYFLYDKYINNDDILSRYLNDLETVDKNYLMTKAGEDDEFKENGFLDFINLPDFDRMIKNIKFRKYKQPVNKMFFRGREYILYLLLEKKLKEKPVVDSIEFDKYIIGNRIMVSAFKGFSEKEEYLEKYYGIYSYCFEPKPGYPCFHKHPNFLGLQFALFSKSKEELEKRITYIKNADKEYLSISEKVFKPILVELNDILLKHKNEFSNNEKNNNEVLENIYIELCEINPNLKYRSVKHFFRYYDLYIIIDSLICKFMYHQGKEYYYKIENSYLDNNTAFRFSHRKNKESVDFTVPKAKVENKSVYGNYLLGGLVGGQTGATMAAMKTIAENKKNEIYNNLPAKTISTELEYDSYDFEIYTENFNEHYFIQFFNFESEIQDILYFYKCLENSKMSLEEYKKNERINLEIIRNNVKNDCIKLLEHKDILNQEFEEKNQLLEEKNQLLEKMKYTILKKSKIEKNKLLKEKNQLLEEKKQLQDEINNIDIKLKYLNKYVQEYI